MSRGMRSTLVFVVLLVGCSGARRATPGSTGATGGPPTQSQGGTLPRTPRRGDVVTSMGELQRAMDACAVGERQEVRVTFLFDSAGTVIEAAADPDHVSYSEQPGPGCVRQGDAYYECRRPRPATPELDACVARVARAARLPPFAAPSFRVSFPFRIGAARR